MTSLKQPANHAAAVREAILAWYRAGHRDLPWRRTRDAYAILVSEIMLQQTQVERVIPKYHQFLAAYPTLAALAAAPRADVIRAWSPLGYNLRAVRLHEIARQAVDRFGGSLPSGVDGLLSLKGIGRYTAGAIACFAFGRVAAVLDTNVRRVLGRSFAGMAPEAAADERAAWRLAETVLPREAADAYDWNQALMDLGATICISRQPRCLLCPVQALCTARQEWNATLPEEGLRVAEAHAEYALVGAAGQADAVAAPPRRPKAQARRPSVRLERFEGSRRWYRGRIVEALRALPPGEVIALDDLGQRVKADYSPAERPWLLDLVQALAADGLIELAEAGDLEVVSLPR